MQVIMRISILIFCFLYALGNGAIAEDFEPYPLDYWALRDVISNVEISPDGKHVALMKIPTKDGNPIIEVYSTDNMSADPYRINSNPMEIQSFFWVSNNIIGMRLRQKVRDKIEGFNQGVYEYLLASVDIKRKKMKKYDQAGASVENILPDKPGENNIFLFSWRR